MPLKYLYFDLVWKCVFTDITTQTARHANPNAGPPVEAREINATLQITDTKLYVPVVTLSAKDDHIFLGTIKIRI